MASHVKAEMSFTGKNACHVQAQLKPTQERPMTLEHDKTTIYQLAHLVVPLSTDKFDNHVYECRKKHCIGNKSTEPFFQLFAFFKVKDASTLESYERHLHRLGLDTMNVPK